MNDSIETIDFNKMLKPIKLGGQITFSVSDLVAPSLYFLTKNGNIQYVGKSSTFGSRVTQHIRELEKGKKDYFFDGVTVLGIEDKGSLDIAEIRMILAIKPPGNKTVGQYAPGVIPRNPEHANFYEQFLAFYRDRPYRDGGDGDSV